MSEQNKEPESPASKGVSRRAVISGIASGAIVGAVAGVASGAVLAPKGATGAQGPAGPAGPAGAPAIPVIASKELTCDILVVGALGLAGLVATLAAAEQGVKVIGIDKQLSNSIWIGGDFPMSGQQVHIGQWSCAEPASTLLAEITSITGGNYCADVVGTLVNNAGAALTWFMGKGITNWVNDANGKPWAVAPVKPSLAWVDQQPGGTSDFTKYGAYAACQTLLSAIKAQSNATLLYGTTGVKLTQDATGRVSGAIAQDSVGRFIINAGATIICTGDFENNKEMMTKYVGPHTDEWVAFGWGIPTFPSGGNVSPSSSEKGPMVGDGSGIKMCIEVGADVRDMGYALPLTAASNCTDISRDGAGIDNLLFLFPPFSSGIVVTKTGARLADEGLGGAGYGSILLRNYGTVSGYIIMDSKIYSQSAVQPAMERLVAEGATIYQANDIPTLATMAGINPYLATTVSNYNAAIANGTIGQQEIPRTGDLTPIAVAPYYAFPFKMAAGGLTEGGIRLNASGNAVNADGLEIPGLYVAGAAMTGNINGGGVQFNYGYADNVAACLIFGYVDAQNAAAYVKTLPPTTTSSSTTSSSSA